MRRSLLFVFATLVHCAPFAYGQYLKTEPVPERWATGFNSITPENARKDLTVLAGKDFAGRGSGQEGFQKAAKWYSEQLAKHGFQPAGTDGSWFQNVPLLRVRVADATGFQLNKKKLDLKLSLIHI